MSGHEEKIYRTSKSKPNIAEMKSQLARLKGDLDHFTARTSPSTIVGPLRERISELQAQIAAAEGERQKGREGEAEGGGAYSASTRYPTRGRRER